MSDALSGQPADQSGKISGQNMYTGRPQPNSAQDGLHFTAETEFS